MKQKKATKKDKTPWEIAKPILLKFYKNGDITVFACFSLKMWRIEMNCNVEIRSPIPVLERKLGNSRVRIVFRELGEYFAS